MNTAGDITTAHGDISLCYYKGEMDLTWTPPGKPGNECLGMRVCLPTYYYFYYACMHFVSFCLSTGVRRLCPSSMLIMNF